MKYCSRCGSAVRQRVPDGDDRKRFVCDRCGAVHYQNPKMVVGCIPVWQEQILLCRRGIDPRYGLWTLPAGYLEIGETVAEGAARETREEAGAEIVDMEPFALYNLAFVGQVYFMFRARLETPVFKPGHESLETGLYREEEIPWDQMAFGVITATLRRFFADRKKGAYGFHTGDILPPEGTQFHTDCTGSSG